MTMVLGIDTGGTYTDAVVYDPETGRVLAKGKSPTTRQDLSLGVGRALDMLPRELLEQFPHRTLSDFQNEARVLNLFPSIFCGKERTVAAGQTGQNLAVFHHHSATCGGADIQTENLHDSAS